MRSLVDEMRAQGIEWDTQRREVSAVGVSDALRSFSLDPLTDVDAKLWSDWLAFLDGARDNGGIVIR